MYHVDLEKRGECGGVARERHENTRNLPAFQDLNGSQFLCQMEAFNVTSSFYKK